MSPAGSERGRLGSGPRRWGRSVCDAVPACANSVRRARAATTSHVLYGRIGRRRIAIYVPDDLVPEIQRALENGRALQDVLYETAQRYTNAVKHQRTRTRQAMP